MGIKRGDQVLLEQPFMNSIIVRGLMLVGERGGVEATRELGWITERQGLERLGMAIALQPVADPCKCGMCRRWAAETVIRELAVCRFCRTELANLLAFRQEPCQLEMMML